MGRNAQRKRAKRDAGKVHITVPAVEGSLGAPRAEPTYWNGERCEARKVWITVGDDGRFPNPWYRPFIGQRRAAVEVSYAGQVFYLDDDAFSDSDREYPPGGGWLKVTEGRGGPRWGHRSLHPEGEVQAR